MSSIENTIPSPEHESNIANQEEETEVTVTADKTDPFEDNPFENDPFEDDPFEDEQNTFPTTTTNTTATTTDTDNLNDDEFGDFDDDFQDAENDDGFGDFDDFEPTEQPDISLPATPTQADEFIKVLEAASAPDEIADYVHGFLENMWPQDQLTTPELLDSDGTTDIICTECSHGLWDKLSCDSVFYNPMTGAIGQFQWTQSETNRAYLNALGVTINYDDATRMNGSSSATASPGSIKRPQSSNYLELKSPNASAGHIKRRASPSHTRSASLSGMTVSANNRSSDDDEEHAIRKPVEKEPELDIDIAKAYCELTEETIRVFPKEKLQAMMGELSRLQRQASEYLGYLLDQREQLMMDAETYNDLISCIVGHAQRLREQNVGKDASPAMVNKKKKSGGLNMLRRKPTIGVPVAHSASMGGGVVGVKQPPGNTAKKTGVAEGRRSM